MITERINAENASEYVVRNTCTYLQPQAARSAGSFASSFGCGGIFYSWFTVSNLHDYCLRQLHRNRLTVILLNLYLHSVLSGENSAHYA